MLLRVWRRLAEEIERRAVDPNYTAREHVKRLNAALEV